MIPKLTSFGVKTILKIICEKIIIKKIQIINKNNKLFGIIDELYIKAESIIFNKINISNIEIHIRDLTLKFGFHKKYLFDNCYAVIQMRLTRDNINKTLFNNEWKSLKNSIENFISMNFQSVEINNRSIYFIPSDGFCNRNIDYTLKYDSNSISLLNKINQEKLLILNDKNIIINNLLFCENYIELALTSKIIFN